MSSNRFIHTVTWWVKSSVSGYDESSFDVPSTITARWEEAVELFRDASGREQISKAVVHIPPESAVVVGDYLFLGESADPNPQAAGAYEVRSVETVDNVTGRKKSRVAIL